MNIFLRALLSAAAIICVNNFIYSDSSSNDISYWGCVSSLVNVFPDSCKRDMQSSSKIEIQLAGNESQSAQIAIFGAKTAVEITGLDVSDLQCGEKKLSANCIEIRLVGYVEVTKLSWRGVKKKGYWPDPLLKFRPFKCPENEARSLWVTISIPRDTPAGVYGGTIKLLSGEQVFCEVPVSVSVMGFNLPEYPNLNTAYWTNFGQYWKEPKALEKAYSMIGKYKVSTNLLMVDWAVWYRDKEGKVICDPKGMQQAVMQAVENGYATLNIGQFNETYKLFENPARLPIIDKVTREELSDDEKRKIASDDLAKAYLRSMCDWLEEKGLLDRAYIQLDDEVSDWHSWPDTIARYKKYRQIEPRIKLLGLIGIHPDLQGLFDIWSPHQAFYDKQVYDNVRNGVSLRNPKAIPAKVSASSTGGWPNGSFYKYRPEDAYDGCAYTKWTPARKPDKKNHEWLNFNFEKQRKISGLKVIPYGRLRLDRGLLIEASKDGKNYSQLKPISTKGGIISLPSGKYKAVRLKMIAHESFVPTAHQQVAPPEPCFDGIREVEFILSDNIEKTQSNEKVKPSIIWEYAVGADHPSVCVDASPLEIRIIGIQCWKRGVKGYLNYGGAQWQMQGICRPKGEDSIFWKNPFGKEIPNGSDFILYPGAVEVLPSIRFARFRDGVEDYDYLAMLERKYPNHQIIQMVKQYDMAHISNEGFVKNLKKSIGNILERLKK